MNETVQLLVAIGSPLFAAGGAYAAVRVHMHYLRRDVDAAHARLDDLTKTLMNERGLSTGKFEALLSHAHPTRPR